MLIPHEYLLATLFKLHIFCTGTKENVSPEELSDLGILHLQMTTQVVTRADRVNVKQSYRAEEN